MSWQDFPMITCPRCGKENQIDDCHELSGGDDFDCPSCEEPIYLLASDWTLSADISAVPPKKEQDHE